MSRAAAAMSCRRHIRQLISKKLISDQPKRPSLCTHNEKFITKPTPNIQTSPKSSRVTINTGAHHFVCHQVSPTAPSNQMDSSKVLPQILCLFSFSPKVHLLQQFSRVLLHSGIGIVSFGTQLSATMIYCCSNLQHESCSHSRSQ